MITLADAVITLADAVITLADAVITLADVVITLADTVHDYVGRCSDYVRLIGSIFIELTGSSILITIRRLHDRPGIPVPQQLRQQTCGKERFCNFVMGSWNLYDRLPS